MRIEVGTRFKTDYDQIWNDVNSVIPKLPNNYGVIINRGYDVINHLFTDGLLFVGINPAFKTNPGSSFNNSINKYPYFKSFPEISKKCGFNGDFSVLDILAVRCTKQSTIRDAINKNKDFKEFCQRQFDVFKKMVCEARPKVIVVCNAYARQWMQNRVFNKSAFDYDFDENIGTYRIKGNNELDRTPVLFTSMLTGQRALDKGSLERLEWQIRHIFK